MPTDKIIIDNSNCEFIIRAKPARIIGSESYIEKNEIKNQIIHNIGTIEYSREYSKLYRRYKKRQEYLAGKIQ